MDISRQAYSEANSTGISMYLSFDSSMSSAAFKTLEASTNELSLLSNKSEEETTEVTQELNQNSTLEAVDSHLDYLETVKNLDKIVPVCAVRKRALQEFNAVSSTPTKEQLLRSVEVVRGSSAQKCVDLKLTFMDLDEKTANINKVTDKENAIPFHKVGTVEPQPEVEITTITKDLTTVPIANEIITEGEEKMDESPTELVRDKTSHIEETKIKPKLENKVSFLAQNKRYSLAKKSACEPDLLTNRPSRIATNVKKRVSLNNIGRKATIEREIATDIPKMMTEILKFGDAGDATSDKVKIKTAAMTDKRKSVLDNLKGRSSTLPSTAMSQAEKRPFGFNQRMSILVRTTLNSPARKIARRSVLPTGQPNWKNAGATVQSKPSRKTILPVDRKTQNVPFVTTVRPQTEAAKSTPTIRKSNYPLDKQRVTIQTGRPQISAELPTYNKIKLNMAAKSDTAFVCNVCCSKFRIKSLLDAHKRSHEGDVTPNFVKKSVIGVSTTASGQSQVNDENKCKYCDKKFALLRTLHIHLLQNCSKIPPSDKRKLEFHEMDHVEKAQLPVFLQQNNSNSKTASQVHSKSLNTAPPRSQSDLSSISASSTDSINDKTVLAEITMIANSAASAVDGLVPEMVPPSSSKVKKATAHSGVHRTPNKSIICHLCKISFKSIMDHVQHNMSVHLKSVDKQIGSGNKFHKAQTNADATA